MRPLREASFLLVGDEGSAIGLRRLAMLGASSCAWLRSAELPTYAQAALVLVGGSSVQRPNKKPTFRWGFYLVGDEGLEPPTSSLSVTRSNQLS